MEVIFIAMILSIVVRRFLPIKGFLWDKDIDKVVWFGEPRVIELRDMTNRDSGDIIKFIKTDNKTKAIKDNSNKIEDGVELSDIKAKECKEVDLDYMYANIDDSEESLSDVVKKGL